MKSAIYLGFKKPLTIENVPDPILADDGVVIKVKATGLCRRDWHGWMGNDADINLPHVPGHELAGLIEAVGKDVTCFNSIANLRKRGKHIQVGIMDSFKGKGITVIDRF